MVNTPNLLTVARVISVPVVIYLLYLPTAWAKWCSFGVFVLAMLSDVADGIIAKRRDQVTTFGTFLDPVADKMLIVSLFLVLSNLGIIPLWVSLVTLWRELLVTGIRSVASSQGFVVGANWMGKTKAVVQTAAIIAAMLYICVGAERLLTDMQMVMVGQAVNLLAMTAAVLSVAFAVIFVYWNRGLLFDSR